jgi:hypothetical protein
MKTPSKSAIAICIAGSATLVSATSAVSAALPTNVAALRNAVSTDLTQAHWRGGWGGWGGFAGGLALGMAGAAIASGPYYGSGYSYGYSPRPYYGYAPYYGAASYGYSPYYSNAYYGSAPYYGGGYYGYGSYYTYGGRHRPW